MNEALNAVQRANAAGTPYFVALAFNAPHADYHKPPNHLHSRDALPDVADPRVPGLQRAYYEAMVEAMDTELGRLLAQVDLARTTVIFMDDNGTPGGVAAAPYNRGHFKSTPYQEGQRVPLLIAGSGVVRPGRLVDALVHVVDLFPTVLELGGLDGRAGLPPGRTIDGVSLVPFMQDRPHPAPHPYVYAGKHHRNRNDRWTHSIRDRDHKLIEWQVGARREFYGLAADPFEGTDLLAPGRAMSAAQQAGLQALDAQLDALLASP